MTDDRDKYLFPFILSFMPAEGYKVIDRLEALRAERDAYHSAMMTAREAANQFLARAEAAEKTIREMVEKAARGSLEGYRELGRKCAELETRAEKAEAEVAEMRSHVQFARNSFRAYAAMQRDKRGDFWEMHAKAADSNADAMDRALAPVEAEGGDDGLKTCGKCGARAFAFNCDTPGCPVAWR